MTNHSGRLLTSKGRCKVRLPGILEALGRQAGARVRELLAVLPAPTIAPTGPSKSERP
jgi:hypothetical protein